jgi:hypothetical protein
MKEFAPYIVPLIFAAIIVRRSMQARKVNIGRLWIRPVILLAMVAGALADAPMPGVIAILAFPVIAVVGVAVGAYMASHQHLTIDEKTGHVSSRTSTIGTLLVLGLFAIRFGAKLVFPELANPGHSHSMMTQAANGLLIFTVAVLIAQTLSIWRRTQPMIAAHAARKLGEGQPVPAAQPDPQPGVQSPAQVAPQPSE